MDALRRREALAQALLAGPEDMSASVDTIPQDSGFLQKLGNALATMPSAQAIKSAVTLPGDVYAGRQQMGLPSETEDLSRVADLAGLAMTGGIAGAPRGAIGSGPMRRTPDLPMDEVSRMARAQEQGYTIDAYKGDAISHLSLNNPDAPYAAFLSSNPEVANRFAEGYAKSWGPEGAAQVYPTKIKFQNPKVIDAKGKHAADFQFGPDREKFLAAFKDHDGVILKNTKDEGDVYVPRDPDQIRSRFAAFDPASEGSGMLLGSGATDRTGAAALAQALLAQE
jgi:hypothetical protein